MAVDVNTRLRLGECHLCLSIWGTVVYQHDRLCDAWGAVVASTSTSREPRIHQDALRLGIRGMPSAAPGPRGCSALGSSYSNNLNHGARGGPPMTPPTRRPWSCHNLLVAPCRPPAPYPVLLPAMTDPLRLRRLRTESLLERIATRTRDTDFAAAPAAATAAATAAALPAVPVDPVPAALVTRPPRHQRCRQAPTATNPPARPALPVWRSRQRCGSAPQAATVGPQAPGLARALAWPLLVVPCRCMEQPLPAPERPQAPLRLLPATGARRFLR